MRCSPWIVCITFLMHMARSQPCENYDSTYNSTNWPGILNETSHQYGYAVSFAGLNLDCSMPVNIDLCLPYPSRTSGDFHYRHGVCLGEPGRILYCWPRINPCWLGRSTTPVYSVGQITALENTIWKVNASGTHLGAVGIGKRFWYYPGIPISNDIPKLIRTAGVSPGDVYFQLTMTFKIRELTLAQPRIMSLDVAPFQWVSHLLWKISVRSGGVWVHEVFPTWDPPSPQVTDFSSMSARIYYPNLTSSSVWTVTRGTFVVSCDIIVIRVENANDVTSLTSNFDIVRFDLFGIDGRLPTFPPTSSPTSSPTTTNPTDAPTAVPSAAPNTQAPTRTPTTSKPTGSPTTPRPTVSPTNNPSTSKPTWPRVSSASRVLPSSTGSSANFVNNLKNLSDIGMSFRTYIPTASPLYGTANISGNETTSAGFLGVNYCGDCLIGWSETDAIVNATDSNGKPCPLNLTMTDTGPVSSPFYQCAGTWTLKSTTRLITQSVQKSFVGCTIWEIDDVGRKHRHVDGQFEIDGTDCTWNQTTASGSVISVDCILGELMLPLTSPTKGVKNQVVGVIFNMVKPFGDNRRAPLVVSWYDILGISYSLRPHVGQTYRMLDTFKIHEGRSFALASLFGNFVWVWVLLIVVVVLFMGVLIYACCKETTKMSKKLMMLDTRGLRTLYAHRVAMTDLGQIARHDTFHWTRHGYYFCVVLGARLVYMLAFSLTFFAFVFTTLNQPHFDTINQYPAYASHRDSDLKNFSLAVETFFNNEIERQSNATLGIQERCVVGRNNAMNKSWLAGSAAQILAHKLEQERVQNNSALLAHSGGEPFIGQIGDAACNPKTADGAIIIQQGSIQPITIQKYVGDTLNSSKNPNAAIDKTTFLPSDFPSHKLANFSILSQLLDEECLRVDVCVGWGYNDFITGGINTVQADYWLFSNMSTPRLDLSTQTLGACFEVTRPTDFSLLTGDIVNQTNQINAQRLADYQASVGSLTGTAQGLYSSLRSLQTSNTLVRTVMVNDPTRPFETRLLNQLVIDFGTGNTPCCVILEINCPNCPNGNFTSPVFSQVVASAQGILNGTNVSSLNLSTQANRVSDLVSVGIPKIDLPSFPRFDLPLDIQLPPLPWFQIIGYAAILDLILMIYRVYRTAGILGRIMRGRDIEVNKRYVEIDPAARKKCCPDVGTCRDRLLDCIVWCSSSIYYLDYQLYKMFYWLIYLFQLAFLAAFILFLYFLVNSTLTIEYMSSLGTFSLLTAGLGAQRSVRNQVIASSAASTNRVSIGNVANTVFSQALQYDLRAISQNGQQLKAINDFNQQWCQKVRTFFTNGFDVRAYGNPFNLSATNAALPGPSSTVVIPGRGAFAVGNPTTIFYNIPKVPWRPRANYVGTSSVEGELSPLTFYNGDFVYWTIRRVNITYRYYGLLSQLKTFELHVDVKNNASAPWTRVTTRHSITPTSNSTDETETVGMDFTAVPEIRFVRVTFLQSESFHQGGNTTGFDLYDLGFFGETVESKVRCEQAQFQLWRYDAQNHTGDCPIIPPVFGFMYTGFVRRWLNAQLITQHTPFMNAIRSIALSPFLILLVGVVFLIMAYLMSFVVEWFLIKADLYRENPWVRVPLVGTDDPRYGTHFEKLFARDKYEPTTTSTIFDDRTIFDEDDLGSAGATSLSGGKRMSKGGYHKMGSSSSDLGEGDQPSGFGAIRAPTAREMIAEKRAQAGAQQQVAAASAVPLPPPGMASGGGGLPKRGGGLPTAPQPPPGMGGPQPPPGMRGPQPPPGQTGPRPPPMMISMSQIDLAKR